MAKDSIKNTIYIQPKIIIIRLVTDNQYIIYYYVIVQHPYKPVYPWTANIHGLKTPTSAKGSFSGEVSFVATFAAIIRKL